MAHCYPYGWAYFGTRIETYIKVKLPGVSLRFEQAGTRVDLSKLFY